VDGFVPKASLESPEAMTARTTQALEHWLARLEAGETVSITRRLLDIPLDATEVARRQVHYGDFSAMNLRWNQTGSAKTHDRLAEDPTEWETYHRLYRAARAHWPVVPAVLIAERLRKRAPGQTVADLGCGEMLLDTTLNGYHTVLGFDHVALDERVTACDIAALPQEDESVDAAVLSLALMGANCANYIKEAQRILRIDGQLWIAETANRVEDVEAFCTSVERFGFDAIGHAERTDRFVIMRFQKAEREPVPGASLAWHDVGPGEAGSR
jgi:hypothetical protein